MNKDRTQNFDLERFLPYRLSVLTNTISQGIAAGYREQFGISITEWRILAVLGRIVESGDQFLTLEVADGVQLKVQRNTVAAVMPKGTFKSA